VRSVYLSDQDSVFQSPQARELQHWLAACADPDDTRRVRTALATPTLGLSWAALDQLNQDELALEGRVLQFRGYRDLWRRQGVLPMLRGLLNDFRVPARLLGGIDPGERVLTDLLAPGRTAAAGQRSAGRRACPHALSGGGVSGCGQGSGGDARLIRLETDADLVRVVTVHKSKGLEYPLVFLPFAADYRPVTAKDLPLKWHDDQGQPQLSLSAPDAVLERANRERLGEDLRKLYVALTRARYATWVGLAPINGLEQGAFGYLLGDGEPLEPTDLAATLAAWRGDCADIALVPAPAPTEQAFRPLAATAVLGTARASRQVVSEPWWIASYSAIGKTLGGGVAVGGAQEDAGGDADGGAARAAAETPTEERFLEMQAARTAVTEAPAPLATPPSLTETPEAQGFPVSQEPPPVPRQPRDRRDPGQPEGDARPRLSPCLPPWTRGRHLPPRSARMGGQPGLRRDRGGPGPTARHGGPALPIAGLGGLDRTPDGLAAPAHHPAPAPAGPGGRPSLSLSLADLTTCVPEMEFWLAAHRVDTQAIDRLVSDHTLGGAPRPALATNLLNGMLKGFMDLVFEHRGRYYVADYKSNWLGPDAAAYSPEAMGAEILHARYELQYVLYLLALHRLLQARLPDYDYDRHVGGAVYLFLRGLAAPSQGLHCERPPRRLIEDLDRLFIGAAQEVTA
jgi:exodeoxyribonuclease V beta subunit